MNITATQLAAIMPRNPEPAAWTPILNAAMAEFEIAANAARIAAFLAQIAHESGELRSLRESLRYSTAKGICATWPKRFPTEASAAPYVSQRGVDDGRDQALANRVYAGRMGNGDVASGDGWRYRGRGLLQVTGRENYRTTGRQLGLPLEAQPERLEERTPAARSAGLFWQNHGLNALADDFSNDDDDADFVAITIAINGGRNGLAERREYWARAEKALGI